MNPKLKKILRHILMTVACAMIAFVIMSLTMLIYFLLIRVFCELGLITESNYRRMAFVDFAMACTIIGCIVFVCFIRYPVYYLHKILDSMRAISHGNYSVRLKKRKYSIGGKLVDAFNSMAQQLENTETLSHDFANNFSHELRTPINSINGFATLLRSKELTEAEREEYLDIIINESEQLGKLSANILNLTRLDNQVILSNVINFDVSEQIRLIIASLYNSIAEKELEIIMDAPEVFIDGNSDMLRQIWINLIDNAIKFSPVGGRIEISVTQTKKDAIFRIKNSGIIIPEEKHKQIFDRFYQDDISHSTKGNGLGLALVKKIAQLHSGEVSLVASDENGTVFEVILPKNN